MRLLSMPVPVPRVLIWVKKRCQHDPEFDANRPRCYLSITFMSYATASSTTLKLPEDLKRRIAPLAKSTGNKPKRPKPVHTILLNKNSML